MYIPPFTFEELSLLYAVNAIVLLITSEIVSKGFGETNLIINVKNLQFAAIATLVLFLSTMVIKAITP